MKNISFVVEVKTNYHHHFQANPRRRLLQKVCKQLSRGYPAIGIYHSHHTLAKGGRFSPHVHLLVSAPVEKLELYMDQLPTDMELKDKTGYFQLSERAQWVLFPSDRLFAYCLGAQRKHTPEIIYGRV